MGRRNQQKTEATQDLVLELEAVSDEVRSEDGELETAADDEVQCRCVRGCVWKGYHDEGDLIRLLMSDFDDPFVKDHFEII